MRVVQAIVAWSLALSCPAAARDLAVPADKGWRHAASGVVLRATLIGLPRLSLADSTEAEWDVSAQFESADSATLMTVFVFHPADPNAPLWFDRARTAIEQRDVYGGATPLAPPLAFARPGARSAGALRQVFATGKGPYRSTGLAVVPVGAWLVAVRLSSKQVDAAALDPLLSEAIAAIRWPAETVPAPVAVPIAACPTTLAFAKARQQKPDAGQALFASVLAGIVAKAPADKVAGKPAEPLCREGEPTVSWGAYRAASVTSAYLLAIGDSGRTVDVYKSFVPAGLPSGYAVSLHDLDGTTAAFPYFDALPRPQQVFDAVTKGRPMSRRAASGDQVTIDAGSVR